MDKIGISDSVKKLINELQDSKVFVKSNVIKFFLSYVPLLSLLFILSIIIFRLETLYLTGAICALVQAIVWIVGIPKTQKHLGSVNHLPYKLSTYSTVIKIINEKEFTSEKLKEIQFWLGTSDLSAEQAIRDLGKITDKLSVRSNGIIYFICFFLMGLSMCFHVR